MPWNTPITWSPGQVVAASDLNGQIRDDLNYLLAARPNAYVVRSGTSDYTTTGTILRRRGRRQPAPDADTQWQPRSGYRQRPDQCFFERRCLLPRLDRGQHHPRGWHKWSRQQCRCGWRHTDSRRHRDWPVHGLVGRRAYLQTAISRQRHRQRQRPE